MPIKLKPLNEQVVVIVGASSGIGRDMALRFAKAGSRVVVAARSEQGLASLVQDIMEQGGKAVYAVCDTTDRTQVQAVADLAVKTYGRVDSWVQVAGVGLYASFEETTPEEFQRLMDINFMGQVHAAQVALPLLRREGRGAFISIGSGESYISMPLNSAYSASKHALEGLMDTLRRELMADGTPISVTSIKPAAINTPFFNNARNKMGVKPRGAPPYYDPSVVSECALYAAANPVRDLYAGGPAHVMKIGQSITPGLTDRIMAKIGIPTEQTKIPDGYEEGSLYAPSGDSRVRGDFTSEQIPSLYTWLMTRPQTQKALLAGTLAVGAWLLSKRKA